MNRWNLPPGMTGAGVRSRGTRERGGAGRLVPGMWTRPAGLVRSYGPDSRFTCDVCQRVSDVDLLSTGERIR